MSLRFTTSRFANINNPFSPPFSFRLRREREAARRDQPPQKGVNQPLSFMFPFLPEISFPFPSPKIRKLLLWWIVELFYRVVAKKLCRSDSDTSDSTVE